MADYKSVPVRTIYKALKKLEAKGELEDFLSKIDKKKDEAIVPVSVYELAVTRLSAGVMMPMSGVGTCPCIGPND